MTDEASNAILKLLEEPPDDCCLLLITESVRLLMPTIVSRCQVIRFAPLNNPEIASALVLRKGIALDKAKTAACLASGSYLRAMSLIKNDYTEILEGGLKFLRAAASGNAVMIVELIDEWSRASSRQDARELLDYIAVWLKDALALKACPAGEASENILATQHADVVGKMAGLYRFDQLTDAWNAVEEAIISLDSNVNLAPLFTALALRINRILR